MYEAQLRAAQRGWRWRAAGQQSSECGDGFDQQRVVHGSKDPPAHAYRADTAALAEGRYAVCVIERIGNSA